jgi:hypothetical protein
MRSEERVFILKQTHISAKVYVKQNGIHRHTNWSSAAVSVSEQFPEDGHVRPKHVPIKCDFNGILK